MAVDFRRFELDFFLGEERRGTGSSELTLRDRARFAFELELDNCFLGERRRAGTEGELAFELLELVDDAERRSAAGDRER
jgi:hypothetical protein